MMHRRLRFAMVLGLLVGLPLSPAPVRAVPLPSTVTLTVDTSMDDNTAFYQACTAERYDCSLRGAISHANTGSSDTTYIIELPAHRFILSITDGPLYDGSNVCGDLDITGGTLIIRGQGAGLSIVDAKQFDRVLDIQAGATVTLENLTITGGQSKPGMMGGASGQNGGGIRNAGTLTLQNVTVTANATAAGVGYSGNAGNGGSGGGISNTGTLVLVDTTISGNATGNGGDSVGAAGGRGGDGGGLRNTGIATLTGSTITDNVTGDGGAGVTAGDGGSGGGITSSGAMTLTATTLSGNATGSGGGDSARGGDGGGLYSAAGVARLTGVTVAGNSAQGRGAGMVNAGGSPTLVGVTFSDNLASGGHGGGFLNLSGDPALTDAVFTGNGAYGGGSGGAFCSEGGAPTLVNALMVGNFANGYGGGLYVAAGTPVLTNTTLSGNESGWGHGGAIYNAGPDVPVVRNSILWGNEGGAQIESGSGAPDADVQYAIVQGGYPGTGNLDQDPAFVRDPDPGGDGNWATTYDNDLGDLHLPPTSPALDAGDNGAVPVGVTTDLDGHPRFVAVGSETDTGSGSPPIVDMGAYESVGSPPVADAGSDRDVAPGASVTLDGSASSDPDGHLPLTYGWAQTGGPPVTLSDPAAVAPHFTAPADPTVLTFTLTVTDSLGLVDPTPDTVVVTVADYRVLLPLVVRSR